MAPNRHKTLSPFPCILAIILLFNLNLAVYGQKRPNVLFILADDLGYHDLGYTGSEYYETPNIDALANESFRFNQGYACAQVCSPSRASILTGNYTATHGITDWIGAKTGEDWRSPRHEDKLLPPDYQHHLKKEWLTLPEAFKKAGYKTFFAGKWHLGGEGNGPLSHGFEINKGGWESGSPKGGYFSPWINPTLENKIAGENLSMRLAKETNAFINAHQHEPFFAFLSFYAVHGPIQTTQQKWEKYRAKAESQGIAHKGFTMERVLPIRMVQDNPVYAGLVETLDDAIGKVIENLKAIGQFENTIIVFTSDNGGVASGDAFATSNLPLRGGKGYQWEGGIREPYIIKGTHKITGSSDFPVSGADFLPTIVSMANLEIKDIKEDLNQLDGHDISPIMKGEKIPSRPIFWHYPHYGNQGGEPVSIIRLDQYKLIYYYEDKHTELYNLALDPGERHDISKKLPTKTKELYNTLSLFLKSRKVPIPKKDPLYNESKRKKLQDYRNTTQLEKLEEQRSKFLSKEFSIDNTWYGSNVTKD